MGKDRGYSIRIQLSELLAGAKPDEHGHCWGWDRSD